MPILDPVETLGKLSVHAFRVLVSGPVPKYLPAVRSLATRFVLQVTGLFNEVIRVIREVDDETPIAAAPMGYSSCPGLGTADKLDDPRVIYTMNWPCHLGTAMASYGEPIACASIGKEITKCIPACSVGTNASVQYDRALLETLAAPTLAFQRKHSVPLWIDQL